MSVDLQRESLYAAVRPYRCVLRIARIIGLCPHKKNHPLGGWLFIYAFALGISSTDASAAFAASIAATVVL